MSHRLLADRLAFQLHCPEHGVELIHRAFDERLECWKCHYSEPLTPEESRCQEDGWRAIGRMRAEAPSLGLPRRVASNGLLGFWYRRGFSSARAALEQMTWQDWEDLRLVPTGLGPKSLDALTTAARQVRPPVHNCPTCWCVPEATP